MEDENLTQIVDILYVELTNKYEDKLKEAFKHKKLKKCDCKIEQLKEVMTIDIMTRGVIQ